MFRVGMALAVIYNMMKLTSIMGKSLGILMLSLSLVYCGSATDSSTEGKRIVIDKQEFLLSTPTLNASGGLSTATLTMSVDDETHLVRFEIERKLGNSAFSFIGETSEFTYADTGMEDGTYTYRVIEVYEIDGQTYLSDYSDEDNAGIGIAQDTGTKHDQDGVGSL